MATMAEYIQMCETNDGVRFSWNYLPISKVEAAQSVVPISCLYTLFKERYDLPPLEYEPLTCSRCRGILNPFCAYDIRSKCWTCCLCDVRNKFPSHYHGMTEEKLPAELMSQFTTLEYTIPNSPLTPPIFLFVVDTCIEDQEFEPLKDAIGMSLSCLPSNALVGLITFGRMVHVHELQHNPISKSWVFKGTKDYTDTQLQVLLSVGRRTASQAPTPGADGSAGRQALGIRGPVGSERCQLPTNKFFQPKDDCQALLSNFVKELQTDSWSVPQGKRPLRSVGTALSIAVGLLESTYPRTGARIMLFLSGPCTQGPGMVIDDDLKNAIRSHNEILKDNCQYMRKAMKHYEGLASRAAQNLNVVDIFSCSLDQTGLHELRFLTNYTGGIMFMGDSFKSTLFQQTYQRVFTKDAQGVFLMGLAGQIEVKTSRELKVAGCIGPCFSANIKTANTSDTEIGVGKTSVWRVNGFTPSTTLAFSFEVTSTAASHSQHQVPNTSGRGYVQFITQYQRANGQRRLRVTTTCRNWIDSSAYPALMINGFDQEAATVIIARKAMFELETTDAVDVLRRLDRQLITLCHKFGNYHKDNAVSFQLPQELSFFPQFMYHLRRSPFMHVFNSSPDETAFYRHTLNREICLNSLLMIQPTLTAFDMDGREDAVLLDTTSIQPQRVLLMDSFFHILIYEGDSITQWRRYGYLENPEYAYINQILQKPRLEAQELMKTRFPLPRYIETEHEGSQARFLLSKVNPSLTHNSDLSYQLGESCGSAVLTDDVSLQGFVDHLKKLAVSSSIN